MRLLEVLSVVGGVGLVLLVGADGSPGWQVARMAAVAGATVLLLAILGRSSERWRGRVAVIAGVPTVAVAVGFAPQLAKGGPLVIQAGAALLGLAGIALVVGGTAVATRGRQWWRRAGAGVLVTVAVGLAIFVVAPPVAATNVPGASMGATPASVGLDYRTVALATADGEELAGWFVPSPNGAAVVLLHGAGSTRSSVLDEAVVLADAGFGVLLVDARGHGDSTGRAMDFGWFGDADVAAATDYLASRPDVDRDRIGVVGMSMGGEEAIGASGTNALVRAVVAEGATGRMAADHGWLSDVYGVRGVVQEQIDRVQDWITGVLSDAPVPASLRQAVESSGTTRYLLVASGAVETEQNAAAHIQGGAPERVEVWTVAGAGHIGGLATAPEEWRDRVVDFLSEALVSPEGRS